MSYPRAERLYTRAELNELLKDGDIWDPRAVRQAAVMLQRDSLQIKELRDRLSGCRAQRKELERRIAVLEKEENRV